MWRWVHMCCVWVRVSVTHACMHASICLGWVCDCSDVEVKRSFIIFFVTLTTLYRTLHILDALCGHNMHVPTLINTFGLCGAIFFLLSVWSPLKNIMKHHWCKTLSAVSFGMAWYDIKIKFASPLQKINGSNLTPRYKSLSSSIRKK